MLTVHAMGVGVGVSDMYRKSPHSENREQDRDPGRGAVQQPHGCARRWRPVHVRRRVGSEQMRSENGSCWAFEYEYNSRSALCTMHYALWGIGNRECVAHQTQSAVGLIGQRQMAEGAGK